MAGDSCSRAPASKHGGQRRNIQPHPTVCHNRRCSCAQCLPNKGLTNGMLHSPSSMSLSNTTSQLRPWGLRAQDMACSRVILSSPSRPVAQLNRSEGGTTAGQHSMEQVNQQVHSASPADQVCAKAQQPTMLGRACSANKKRETLMHAGHDSHH